jgi:membrane protease YdiL (CAAX protease family)
MNSRKFRVFELILILSIAFLPSLILSINHLLIGSITNQGNFNAINYIVWLTQGLLSIVLLFYILKKNNRSYSEIGLKLKFEWKDLLFGLGLMISAIIINAILLNIINIISPETYKQAINPQNVDFLKTNLTGFLFIIVIVFPVQEELIVRGFTMSEIFNLTSNKSLAVAISVMIQFSYHIYQGLIPALMLLPFFIIVSIYFVKTGNLNPVILAHIFIDLMGVILKK